MSYVQLQQKKTKIITEISQNIIVKTTKAYLGAKLCCATIIPKKEETMNIEQVQKAIYEGDNAIMNLMDELSDFVKVVSEEYRNCLKKQMEITEKSQNVGPFSESWDELPQYRTLADELQQQLNNFSALFETLGKMLEIKYSDIAEENDIFLKMNEKFKEHQELIRKEFEENRKLEVKLLRLNCDNILMDVLASTSNN